MSWMPEFSGGSVTTSGIAGGVGSFGLDLAGTAFGASLAAKAASKQWRRQKTAAKMKHVWNVESLRAAGLNPILSATQGPGGGPAPGMAGVPGTSSSGSRAVTAAREAAMFKSQKDVLDTQADNNATSAMKNRETALRESFTSDLLRGQTKKTQWEALNAQILSEIQAKNFEVADFEATNARNMHDIIKKYPMVSALERYGPTGISLLNEVFGIPLSGFGKLPDLDDPAGTKGKRPGHPEGSKPVGGRNPTRTKNWKRRK